MVLTLNQIEGASGSGSSKKKKTTTSSSRKGLTAPYAPGKQPTYQGSTFGQAPYASNKAPGLKNANLAVFQPKASTGKAYTYSGKSNTTPNKSSGSSKSSNSNKSGSTSKPATDWAKKAYDAQTAAQKKADAEKKAREKRENDTTKAQVKALKSMIDKEFAKNRDLKIADIDQVFAQQDKLLTDAFNKRSKQLDTLVRDNRMAEHDATYNNVTNRARERMDLLTQAAGVGAGETDMLRTQQMAARNWAENQNDVNRAFYDTQTSINNSKNELNLDTKTSRANLAVQTNKDKSAVWDDYYSRMQDTWNQISNLEGSNTNESYKVQHKNAMDKSASYAGKSWNDPGIPKDVTGFTGTAITEDRLNNTRLKGGLTGRGEKQSKRPEGAGLRKW